MTVILPKKRVFVIGVDLGGRAESTGICVLQSVREREYDSAVLCPIESQTFHVRHLHRSPAATTYTEIIECIKTARTGAETPSTDEYEEIAPGVFRKFADDIQVVINRTAVGAPVIDKMRRELGPSICQVQIIEGLVASYHGGVHQVPKKDIVDGIYILLEDYRIKIAQGLLKTQSFTQELIEYRSRPISTAPSNSESGRDLPIDDLIFAMGTANWRLHNPGYLVMDK